MSKGEMIKRELAERIAREFIDEFFPTRRVEVVGSIRRKKPMVGDVDLIVLDPDKVGTQDSGEYCGIMFNVWYADENCWGAMTMFATGPARYNIAYRRRAKNMGLKLNRYGLFNRDTGDRVAGETEEAIYEELGKKWKAPELRGVR